MPARDPIWVRIASKNAVECLLVNRGVRLRDNAKQIIDVSRVFRQRVEDEFQSGRTPYAGQPPNLAAEQPPG